MTGDRFVINRGNDGLYYWELWGASHPTMKPIARSDRGYQSASNARKSIESARKAMENAVNSDGSPRITDD